MRVHPTIESTRARVMGTWPVLPALALYAAGAAAMRGFVTDDALITLRYARQWADGYGITWNTGEDPVEGFTNFSHVALGALALLLKLPALSCLRAFNVFATFGLILLTYDLARRTLHSRAWAAAAATLVGIHPALAFWSVSGLETSAYACALLLGVWALQVGRHASACAAFLAASLTRFEGPAAVAVVLGIQLVFEIWRRRRAGVVRVVLCIGAFCLVYGAYFAWRYHYFGYALSNSAYYKGTGANGELVRQFVLQNRTLLALVLLAPFLRMGCLGWQLLGLIVTYAVGFYGVNPSVAQLHRFFLPVFAPVVLLAVAALQRAWLTQSPRHLMRYACMALLAVAAGSDVGNAWSGLRSTIDRADRLGGRSVVRARVAAFIAGHYPISARVVAQDVGVLGYALLNPIDDSFGLNNEELTHRFDRDPIPYLNFILARNPELIVLTSETATRLRPAYQVDSVIARNPRFWNYRRMTTVTSEAEKYHYMVFARSAVAARANPIEIAVDAKRDLGTLIDEVAKRSWQAQRTSRR